MLHNLLCVRVFVGFMCESDVSVGPKFRYLGSTLPESGGCGVRVEEGIKTGWRKWREDAGMVCDERVFMERSYKTVKRIIMTYGIETRALKNTEESRQERKDMRMLIWAQWVYVLESQGVVGRRAGVECMT